MKDLEKVARTIAGLYNHATSPGMGAARRIEGKMKIEDALRLAREAESKGLVSFDWLQGRVIKVAVYADGRVERGDLYDRDNGEGACARAIAAGMADPSYDFGYLIDP